MTKNEWDREAMVLQLESQGLTRLEAWRQCDETREEILDTIEVCQSYIDDAVAAEGAPLARLFTQEAMEHAYKQISCEIAKLKNNR